MTNYPIVHFLLLPLSAAEPVKSLSKENLQNHVNGLSIEQDTLRLFNIRKWSFCTWLKNMMHLAKKKWRFSSLPRHLTAHGRPDASTAALALRPKLDALGFGICGRFTTEKGNVIGLDVDLRSVFLRLHVGLSSWPNILFQQWIHALD